MGRRKWTAEQKMEIVLAGMAPGANISAVCREYGIVQTQYYKWREAFIQGGLSALKTGISNREQELEKELEKAKALIGEKEIQIEILPKKDELGPKVKTRDLVRILHGEGYSVPQITAALRINRTYGYALLKEYQPKKRERSDEAALRQKIQELCGEFPTNGYRRIRVWLYKRHQLRVNHKRVYRIMKELGLLTRSKGGTASRKKQSGRIPVTGSNQHFQVDMTKIWCGRDGWGYLFAVIDAYDKEIVGYSFSRFCRTDELLSAVNQALENRFPHGVKGRGLTIRSDNGCQMTSRRYVKALQDAGIKQERTGYNNPDADAYIERWFRTLKEETVWLQEYTTFLEAKKDIDRYIRFYNAERPHSALGYLSPKEFRQRFTSNAA